MLPFNLSAPGTPPSVRSRDSVQSLARRAMRRLALVCVSMLVLALGISQCARAVTNLGTANSFNVFDLGNDSQSNTDAAGKIAAGGNATFSSYTACSGLGSGSAVNLVVGGTLTMTGGNIHGSTAAGAIVLHDPTASGNLASVGSTSLDSGGTVSGNILYGTTYSNAGRTTVSGTVTKGSSTLPINFSTESGNLKSLSSTCAGYAVTGATTVSYGAITLNGSKSGLNVFSVSGSTLASANGLTINVPAGSTALVNVSGSADQMQNFAINIKGTTRQYVVFNFPTATTLTFGGIAIEGSVLAPLAAVNFSNGNFDGTLVCASLSGSGEGHSYPFLGDLTPASSAPTLTGLSLNPTSVPGGTSSTGTVTLSVAAPTGGTVVTLSSDSTAKGVTVPTSVTVASGQTTATFTTSTAATGSNFTATISATLGSTTRTATLAVTAPTLTSLSLNPTSVVGGTSSQGTVVISSAAPAGGLVISLASDSTAQGVAVPTSATISSGQTTGSFTLTTLPTGANFTATIGASLGSTTRTATLAVTAPTLTALSLDPTSVVGGVSSQGTVTISSVAPTGGLAIALSSDSTAGGVTVLSTVTIAAGQTSGTFTVSTTAVAANLTATITGTLNEVSQTATLGVTAPTLLGLALNPTSVIGGNPSTGTVTISSIAPSGGIVVALSTTDQSVKLPASVTIPGGATTATFQVNTTIVPSAQTASIKATYSGGSASANLVITPIVPLSLSLTPVSVVGGDGTVVTGQVTLNAKAPQNMALALASSNPAGILTPTLVVVKAGSAVSQTFKVITTPVTSGTSDVITAALVASPLPVSPIPVSATLTVNPPSFTLSVSPNSVEGAAGSVGTVSISVPAPQAGLTITLSSDSTAFGVTVPASVTIAAGATSQTFPIATAAVGKAVNATISASVGTLSQTASLQVTPPTVLSVSVSPSSVVGGNPATATVTLSSSAPATGLVLQTQSDNGTATVGGTVFVPSQQKTATFRVATSAVSATQTANISAGFNGSTAAGPLTITPSGLTGLNLDPGTVVGGLPSVGTVFLAGPAGPAGAVVALSTTSTSASVPATVTVPAGSVSATFPISTFAVSSTVVAPLNATLGSAVQTANLTITPPDLVGVSLTPNSVTGGSSSSARVTISTPAPVGGTVVSLASSESALGVTVQSSVTIPAGATSATVPVSTLPVGAVLTSNIIATLNGVSASAILTVNPPVLTGVTLSPTSVVGGQPSVGSVTISGPAPVGGLSIAISSSTASATVAGSVTVPAGQTTATFPITTSAVASTTSATITGTLGSVSVPATLTITAVTSYIMISPGSAIVLTGATQQYTATAYDATGVALTQQPAFTWSVSGGGTIDASTGLFTAGSSVGGPFTVTATAGSLSGTASVTVDTASTQDSPLKPTAVITSTKWVADGCGGIRDLGTGTIAVSGIPATASITRAYLYWQGPIMSTSATANANVTFNGNGVTGTNIGFANNNCWGYTNSQAYRCDVTNLVSGNGAYTLANFVKLPGTGSNFFGNYLTNIDGVELIVFYNDGNTSNNQDVYLYDGNNSDEDAAQSWNDTLSGISYTSGPATLSLGVADGQNFGTPVDAPLYINGTQFLGYGDWWIGVGGNGVVNGPNTGNPYLGGLWDWQSNTITSLLKPGTNSLTLTNAVYHDCISLVIALVSVNSAANHALPTPPTVTQAAVAIPNPVTGTATNLSVLGADANGEVNLTYTWSAVAGSPAPVNFSVNGTNAAKNCVATFTQAGSYNIQVVIRNQANLSVVSSVVVQVNQTPTSIAISPLSASVNLSSIQQFTATGSDQFGNALTTQPAVQWSVQPGGVGSIDQTGLYASGTQTGTAVISAQLGSLAATANVAVTNAGPSIKSIQGTPNPDPGATANLSVVATDPSGNSGLTYSWYLVGPAAGPVGASDNGDNAASNITVYFTTAGTYTFEVVVADPAGLTASVQTTIVVVPTLTTLAVSPPQVTLAPLASQAFTATGQDQFGNVVSLTGVVWSVISGSGSIDQNGNYTEPFAGGSATVQAAAGSVMADAYVDGANTAPTIAVSAAANPNPVTGNTTSLSVLGADDGGEANLTYAWSTLGTPPAPVAFADNGDNSAKNTTATFGAAGNYVLKVVVTDSGGLTASSTVSVTVNQTLTSLSLSPNPVSVPELGTQQFTAAAADQFGAPAPLDGVVWTVSPVNGGTVSQAGLYTAPRATGTVGVTATSGTVTATAVVTLTSVAPTIVTAASATPNPVPWTTTALSVLAADPAGESTLTYTWSLVGVNPAAVAFSSNGTNAAKYTTATFRAVGTYNFQVVTTDLLGLSAAGTATVTVNQTAAKIIVNPISVSLLAGGTQQFTATEVDQFGYALTAQPGFAWTVNGGGTIDPTAGLFTAGSTAGGPYTVTATAGSLTGNSTVTIVSSAPVLTSIAVTPATASVTEGQTKQFSAIALDQYGNVVAPQPSITWSVNPVNGGTVTSTGLYTAPSNATGTAGVVATSGSVSGSAIVTVVAPGGPSIAAAASSSPTTVTGTTSDLSVLGADAAGESTLTYTWSVAGTAPSAVTFSANGTNGAKNCIATFGAAGSYVLLVTVTDQYGLTASSSVTVTVLQSLTSIVVNPASAGVLVNTTQQYSATGLDQFGVPTAVQPNISWTVSGGGTIGAASGLFDAANTSGGPYTVTASDGVLSGSANVTVTSSVISGTPTVISCGQTLAGNLSTTSAPPIALGAGYYANDYTFTGQPGETVVISENSTAFDAFLTLYDPAGTQVAQNNDSLNLTSNSQIVYTLPATLLGSGVYTIEATAASPGATGPYTISLVCSQDPATATLSATVNGAPVAVNGTVDFGTTPQGTPVQKTLTLTNTGIIDLALTSFTAGGDWSSSGSLQPVIEPGQSESVTLQYNAANVGAEGTTLKVGNTTAVNPYVLNLTGTSTSTNNGPSVSVTNIAFNPKSVVSGHSTVGTVTLSGPAPTGGQVVNLSTTEAAIFPIPASVTVPAGSTTATFTVSTSPQTKNYSFYVHAFIGPITGVFSQTSTQVTVIQAGTPPTVSISSPANNGTVSVGSVPVTATASATISGASIAKVDFYVAPVTGGTAGAFASIGEATTSPYTTNWSAALGTYQLEAIATDSVGLTATSSLVTVIVSSQPSVTPPSISATDNTGANLPTDQNNGSSVGFATITLSDSFAPTSGQPVVIYYAFGSTTPDPATSPRYTGPFPIVYNAAAPKVTVNAIAVSAGYLNSQASSATYDLTPGPKLGAPTASITSPGDGGEAMGQVPIVGIAYGPAFGYWEIDYQLAGSTGGWTEYNTGTTAVQTADPKNPITILDTSLMLDGQYDIRLTVYDTDGQTAVTDNYVVIKGHQKLGYMTLSYTDMTIPIAGIPISITRTYDSRDKTPGDFGIGWTLSTTNVKVQKPEVSAFDWEQVQYGGFSSPTYVLQPMRAHNVTITLPGDTVYSFQEQLNPNQAPFYDFVSNMLDTNVVYEELSGPKATLTPLDDAGNVLSTDVYVEAASDVMVNGKFDPNLYNSGGTSQAAQLYEGDLTTPYNPDGFILTMGNGTKYKMDTSGSLISITDRNGNEVDFSSSAITSTGSTSIKFSRSGSYITGITDPNGNKFSYTQGANGDLISATDRTNNATTYDYDEDHNLTDIVNALGIMPIRNYYYPDGRLDYTLDAYNHQTNYYYNNAVEPGGAQPASGPVLNVPANSEITTDALGNPTVSVYDSYGNVTQSIEYLTDATHTNTPVTRAATYNDLDPYNPDKPLTEIDPLGHETDYSYDSNGDTLSVLRYLTSSSGSKTKLTSKATYDTFGNVLTETDPKGIVRLTNTYDRNGNLLSSRDALGNTTALGYNSDGSVRSSTNQLSQTTYFKYDHNSPQGNLISKTDPTGHTVSFSYDANGNRTATATTRTTLNGQVQTMTWSTVYDSSGRITQSQAPDGTSTQTYYNSLGTADHQVDALGRVTFYSYDEMGRLVKTIDPDGTTLTTAFDADGREASSRDRSGRGEELQYDTLGRADIVYPLDGNGNKRTDIQGGYVNLVTQFDLNGEITSQSDADGNVTQWTYDSLGRKISSIDALGNISTTQYDIDGYVASITDANGNSTLMTSDYDGRLIEVQYADGTTKRVTYDGLGRNTSTTDQMSRTTSYKYDPNGRLTSVENPQGDITTYSYDEVGDKISQTDANGHKYQMAYDSMSRLIERVLPAPPTGYVNTSAQIEARTYDALGRLSAITDNNGLITTFVYDPKSGYLLSKDGSNGDFLNLSYNSDGTVAAESRGNGTVTSSTITNSYDPATGNLTAVASTNGTISYKYDNAGNKIETDAPSGIILMSYDSDNRLKSVSHPGSLPLASYSYDRVGNRAALTLGNGLTTQYTYDNMNRLTNLDNGTGANFQYGYQADGRIVSCTESGSLTPGVTNYSYDQDGRLTSEIQTSASGTLLVNNSYQYDAVGNRVSKVVNGVVTNYEYDANDRITCPGYSFDADGNQTTVNGKSAAYDFENHLVMLGAETSPDAIYTYDPDGNRQSEESPRGTVNYLVDKSTPLATVAEERDENGALLARYDYGYDLISWTQGSASWYYEYNGHGDARAVTDSTGAVGDSWSYDAFGNELSHAGQTTNEFLFNGQQIDTPSGSYYMRARYYSGSDGRFLTNDPYAGDDLQTGSLHRYMYTADDPVDLADPSGNRPLNGNDNLEIQTLRSWYNRSYTASHSRHFDPNAAEVIDTNPSDVSAKDGISYVSPQSFQLALQDLTGYIGTLGNTNSLKLKALYWAIGQLGQNWGATHVANLPGFVPIEASDECNYFVASAYVFGAGVSGWPSGSFSYHNFNWYAENAQAFSINQDEDYTTIISQQNVQPGDIVAFHSHAPFGIEAEADSGHVTLELGGSQQQWATDLLIYAGGSGVGKIGTFDENKHYGTHDGFLYRQYAPGLTYQDDDWGGTILEAN